MEVFPIIGITDLKVVPEVPSFTLDWTGIPIIFITIGLGLVYSMVSIGVMGVAIGYRNPVGAVFKVAAESLTVIGYFIGRTLVPRRFRSEKTQLLLGLLLGSLLRAAGMVYVNVTLLPVLYGLPTDLAYSIGMILFPWNILQAAINIVGGTILYRTVPENLALQVGLGEGRSMEETRFRELETPDSDRVQS